jgi:HK97 gp10 family phage protein
VGAGKLAPHLFVMDISVNVNTSLSFNFSKNLESKLRIAQKIILKKIVSDAEVIIRKKVNDKHQHISDSLKTQVSGLEARIYIDPNNKPAIFVHEGTRPHFVQPTNKKALYWVKGGGKHFSKGHMVSGIKPVKFLEKAFKQNKEYIVNEVKKAVREAI